MQCRETQEMQILITLSESLLQPAQNKLVPGEKVVRALSTKLEYV